MTNEHATDKATGSLKHLLAKVQAMTILADAGMKISEIGGTGTVKDENDCLYDMAVNLKRICNKLAKDINEGVAAYGCKPLWNPKEDERVEDEGECEDDEAFKEKLKELIAEVLKG